MTDVELDLVVRAVSDPARDVRAFRLAAADGIALPPVSAGAHVRFDLDVDGRHLANAYSLMSCPDDPGCWLIAVKLERQGRGGSRFFHERVRVGDRLRAAAPVNAFPLEHTAPRHLFVAGGIGITPFVSMMAEAEARGLDFALHWSLHERADGPFLDALVDRWGDRLRLHVSTEGGRVDLDALLAAEPAGSRLYVCGSDRLVEATLATARRFHWPESRLHREVFATPADGDAFVVRLARSGRDVTVGAEETLLDALEAAGCDVGAMCRGGACGACETVVLARDGTILHADQWLDAAAHAAGDRIMPCVSRFSGRLLTLDL